MIYGECKIINIHLFVNTQWYSSTKILVAQYGKHAYISGAVLPCTYQDFNIFIVYFSLTCFISRPFGDAHVQIYTIFFTCYRCALQPRFIFNPDICKLINTCITRLGHKVVCFCVFFFYLSPH